MYAHSLSLRSEELDADTVYSFVPNIGDSDPSSRCTYSKITNGANVDLNHSFLKQVLRTQLCVHHDAVVIVIWVIWSKCASKCTKMCVMKNPGALYFCLSIHLHVYFVYASSEGSCETACIYGNTSSRFLMVSFGAGS